MGSDEPDRIHSRFTLFGLYSASRLISAQSKTPILIIRNTYIVLGLHG